MKKLSIILLTFIMAFVGYAIIDLLIYITPTIETLLQGVAMGVLWAFIISLLGTTAWMILCLIKQNFKQ